MLYAQNLTMTSGRLRRIVARRATLAIPNRDASAENAACTRVSASVTKSWYSLPVMRRLRRRSRSRILRSQPRQVSGGNWQAQHVLGRTMSGGELTRVPDPSGTGTQMLVLPAGTKTMVTIMPIATFAEVFTVRSRGRGIGQQKSHLDHDLQCNVAVGTYLGIKESSGGVKLCRGVLFVAIRHGATSGFADAIQSTTESSMLSRAHLLGLHERRSPGRATAEQISLLLARVLFHGRLIVRPYLLQLVAHQRHKLPNLGFVRGCVVTERAYKVSRHLRTLLACAGDI